MTREKAMQKRAIVVTQFINELGVTIETNTKPLIYCKDCKHFTLNLVENVDGIPLIVAHEVCSFWGDGCKTSQEGFCSFGERKQKDVD